MNKILHLFTLCLLINFCQAQEQLGLTLDNYGGVNTILLNPAAGAYTPFAWDVNLVAIDVFVENNYAFFENTHVFDVLNRLNTKIEIRPEIDNENDISPESLILDFFAERQKRFISIANNVTGPSALVQLPNQQSIGLLTRMRIAVYSQNIPANLSYYEYRSQPILDNFSVTPFQLTTMAWSEIGLHYSKAFTTYEGEAAVGINLKYLQGYEAAFLNNESSLRITRLPNDSVQVSSSTLSYGFTNGNTQEGEFALERNGRGISADIGINFSLAEYSDGYRWRIGASFMDIGQINFKENTERYQLNTDTLIQLYEEDYRRIDNIDDLEEAIETFNRDVLENSTTNAATNEMKIWLPAAFSLQADYAFNASFYFNATYIQRLPIQKAALQRGNLFALSPRYESRWITAALPVSLYNWQDFRFGLSLRLGFLTIGSDNLGSIFTRSNFTGTDFYLALKVNPFQLNTGGKSRKKRGKVVCPAISR